MTAYEFNQKFGDRVKTERRITNEILHDILRAENDKFHLQLGFSSLLDWLTTGHGYSGSAAQRRIQAARLLRAVPELSVKLENGSTNISVAARAQSAFVQMEKLGHKVPQDFKSDIIGELEGKSTFEAERKLMETFPELEQLPMKDTRTVVAKDRTRIGSELTDDTIAILDRVKELLSHQIPDGSINDVLHHLGEYFLKREDPLRKASAQKKSEATAAAANSCVKNSKAVSRPAQRVVIQESDDRCEFCDPVTGRRCNSRYQTQTDHIHMRVFGGGNDRQNLRRYCRAHNIWMSEQQLGRNRANAWRRSQQPAA
ncbi:MAG: HNH endonuclease signature motif containing protein [Pseudobdellovibrionaceae bacterium]